jgi:hypothetical protein
MNTHWRTLTGSFTLTLSHRDRSRVPIRIDVETIVSGLGQRERQIGRVNLPHLAVLQMPYMYIQRALVESHLHRIIVNVGQCEAGLGVDSQYAGAYIQLAARVFIRPDVVRIGQRTVRRTFHPVPGSLRLNGDLSGHVL